MKIHKIKRDQKKERFKREVREGRDLKEKERLEKRDI